MKRTPLLCVLAVLAVLITALPALSVSEMYSFTSSSSVPVYINFILNCKSDVTIQILPCDTAGVITLPEAPVRTVTYLNQPKGPFKPVGRVMTGPGATPWIPGASFHWDGENDALDFAGAGYYVARVTCTNVGTGPVDSLTLRPSYQIDAFPMVPTEALPDPGPGIRTTGSLPPISEFPYRNTDNTVTLPANSGAAFMGIGVNANKTSPYYGWQYLGSTAAPKSVYVYGPAGDYKGLLNADTVAWAASAVWTINVADDGYIIVTDCSAAKVYAFSPDGFVSGGGTTPDKYGHLTASSAAIGGGNWTGTFARTYSNGTIHFFGTDRNAGVKEVVLNAARTAWTLGPNSGIAKADGGAYSIIGNWVSADLLDLYTAGYGNGTDGPANMGIRKWHRATVSAQWSAQVAGWGTGAPGHNGAAIGDDLSTRTMKSVVGSADGTFLWAGVMGTATPDLYKVSMANGRTIALGKTMPGMPTAFPGAISAGVLWPMPDAVGNFAFTYGGTSGTAAAAHFYYNTFDWGTAPVAGTARLTTQRYTGDIGTPLASGVFQLLTDPSPALVQGDPARPVTWTTNPLDPNGTTTTNLSFYVFDANGWTDIASVVLDLKEIMATGGTTTVTATAANGQITQDMSDVSGKRALVTFGNITAVPGTRIGIRSIEAAFNDVHQDIPRVGSAVFPLTVLGNTVNTTVRHTVSLATVSNAVVTLVGGVSGVWGYPNTYTGTADASGYVSMGVSEGAYTITATKGGYKTQTPAPLDIDPYPSYRDTTVGLGPLTVAEALAYGTGYCSVQGLVYAQPQGGLYKAPFVAGMGVRADGWVSGVLNPEKQSFYICDAGIASKGIMVHFAQTKNTTASMPYYTKQWDDPTETNLAGNSTYIGVRPADGDTICFSGNKTTPSNAYETEIEIDSAAMEAVAAEQYPQWYLNMSATGAVPNQPLPTPVAMNIPAINAGTAQVDGFGAYAKVSDVTVVAWRPEVLAPIRFYDGLPSTDPVDYVIVADSLNRYGTVAFTTLKSYGLDTAVCPVTIGSKYNFTGAFSKLHKYDYGTIRVKGAGGIELLSDGPALPDANTVGLIRGVDSGTITIRGIVTLGGVAPPAAAATFMYVESADRSVGVRVKTTVPWWASAGTDIVVTGTVANENGMKTITPTAPLIPMSSGNALPELGMRTMDVGGKDFGTADFGVTNGRGPLNVGLYVTVQGMVTYRNTAGPFYIWDGGNMVPPGPDPGTLGDPVPLADGTGNTGLRVAHNGWVTDPSGHALVPYKDFVTIKGIVGVNQTAVPGSTIPEIIPISIRWNQPADFTDISDAGVGLLPGVNLFSLPAVPANNGTGVAPNPDDASINRMPWDPMVVFLPNNPNAYENQMFRLENTTGGQYLYDEWATIPFGGMMLSGAYLMQQTAAWPVSYKGLPSTIPQWVGVDKSGMLWMGCPQQVSVELGDITVSNGGEVKSFVDASQYGANWLNSNGFWIDNTSGGQYSVGLPDDFADGGTRLFPWRGYFFMMSEDTKAWIIPVSAPAPPPE